MKMAQRIEAAFEKFHPFGFLAILIIPRLNAATQPTVPMIISIIPNIFISFLFLQNAAAISMTPPTNPMMEQTANMIP